MNIELYKKLLKDEKKRIEGTMTAIKDNVEEGYPGSAGGEISMIDNHPADLGTEMFDRQRSFALIDNEKRIIKDINDALDRIDKGDYGKCEVCSGDIEEERLNFMPYARTCAECSKKIKITNDHYRPSEEDTLSYPFGRSFKDIGDTVEYDGEDTWQDVDSFNDREGIIKNYDDEKMEGVVEDVDNISNNQYKNQLP